MSTPAILPASICSTLEEGTLASWVASTVATMLAKFGANWSTYLNGTLYDKEKFTKELNEVGAYLSEPVA